MSRCLTQESKFLVLNKKSAWDRGLPVNVDVSDDGLKIRQTFEYVFDQENEVEVLADTFEVTDFAVAGCGQIYILDAATPAIWIYDTVQKQIEKIDCLGSLFLDPPCHPTRVLRPTTIAYSSGQIYVGDPQTESRVFVLSERNWQVVATIGKAPSETVSDFEPKDLALDTAGNLFALDSATPAILKFDPRLQLVEVFGRAELNGKVPQCIAVSDSGALYVLDGHDQKVLKFDTGSGRPVNPDPIDFQSLKNTGVVRELFEPGGFAIDTDGNLFIGDAGPKTRPDEDDRFLLEFDPEGQFRGVVSGSRGAANEIAIDLDNSIFIFRREAKNKIAELRRQTRFALADHLPLVQGTYFAKALDSRDAGTVWHKLTAESATPANTQIQISFYAGDEKLINVGGSSQDLDLFIDDTINSGPTSSQLSQLNDLPWSEAVVNSNDALITATGRYLWTRIVLTGTESESPSLHSLRVDYPRITYLRYLPAIYSEDDLSRDFLERFLSLFETFFAGLEARADHMSAFFDADARVVTGEFLRWLSSWLAISVDKSWDDAKLRTLVKRATAIYKQRGTRAAIEEMIGILLGDQPLIVEAYQTSCAAWSSSQHETEFNEMFSLLQRLYPHVNFNRDELRKSFVLEALYQRLYGTDPFCFCVLLKPLSVRSEETYNAVRRLLAAEKPAHTCAGLMTLQPWIQLDAHTYLEVNTYLSRPSARLDSGSAIPRDTVLDEAMRAGQLESQSRIELDMVLI